MKRLISLDEMVKFDDTMDRFEELCRHGYSLDKVLEKLDDEDSFDDWTYWER